MDILTQEMQAAVGEIRFCYASSASLNGEPNESPKGTLRVLDGIILHPAALPRQTRSQNLRVKPRIEISMIDQKSRRGLPFTGTPQIRDCGSTSEQATEELWDSEGGDVPVHHVVRVYVAEEGKVLSKAHMPNIGLNIEKLRAVWIKRYAYQPLGIQV